MSTELLHSVVLPMDGFLALGWDRGRLCVAATVPGRVMTFYELSRSLDVIHEWHFGTNPSGPAQPFAPNDFRFCEMEPGDTWPEWKITFNDLGEPLAQPTGRRLRAGTLQWRDGHVVSYVSAGHLEYDGQLVPFPDAQGSAGIAGDQLLAHNHGNTRLYRRRADGNGWETRDVPAFLFGQAQIAPDGTVIYSAFPDGLVRIWTPGGGDLDGEMPTAVPQNPNWAWEQDRVFADDAPSLSVYYLCSAHDGQRCAIGSDGENGYLALEGGSEPYARACEIGENEAAVARWDSLAKVIRVDTLRLDQAFTPVEPPIIIPPDPPTPQPPPMPELELLLSTHMGEAPLTVEGRVYHERPNVPIEFLSRRQPALAWTIALRPADAEPDRHFYRFTEAGTYDTRARQAGAVDSNIRTVTVVAPPPPPEPEPTPPSGGWLVRLIALLRRLRR